MLKVKNAITYRVDALPSIQELDSALQEHPIVEPGPQEAIRHGWLSPLSGLQANDGAPASMVADGHGVWLIAMQTAWRDLPAAIVRRKLQERVEKIEETEQRKVYRRERAQLKDEVMCDLLPRAFIKQRQVYALIDPGAGLIHVLDGSFSRAEGLLSLLRLALGSLKVRLPEVAQAPSVTLSRWLLERTAPEGWSLGHTCTLREQEDKGTIIIRDQDLLCDEVKAHLETGCRATQLALGWRDRVSLLLGEDLRIRKLQLSQEYIEQHLDEAPEDQLAALEADIWLWGNTLRELHADLMLALGAESGGDAADDGELAQAS